MGLDQYLTKEIYIGANYEYRGVKGTFFAIDNEGNPFPINFNRISTITEHAAYWRKANQIHKWFVDNVQGGKDDCKEYRVTLEQLKELVKLCKQVKRDNSKASELLPTQAGFFFGGTEYDQYYFEDIDSTIKQLTPLIKEMSDENFKYDITVKYCSSW